MRATAWRCPLTPDTHTPTQPGEIVTAAIALWIDRLNEVRGTRPRTADGKRRKKHITETASSRLSRYHGERERLSHFSRPNQLTIRMASDDLSSATNPRREGAA